MTCGISLLVNKLIGVPNWKVEILGNILSISTCLLSKSLLYKGNAVFPEPCNLAVPGNRLRGPGKLRHCRFSQPSTYYYVYFLKL